MDYFAPMDRSNIAETPNPKPLSVERVRTPIIGDHGVVIGYQTLIFRNANLDPAAIARRW